MVSTEDCDAADSFPRLALDQFGSLFEPLLGQVIIATSHHDDKTASASARGR